MDAAARTAGLQHSLPDMKLERLDKLVFFLENEIQAKAGGEPAANVAPIVAAEGEVELVVGEDQQHKNLKSDEKQSVSESSHKGAGIHQLKNDIFSELQRLFPDITHQFAALELVREYFERKKAKDEKRLRELLDEAKAEFESSPEMMRDIRAGFAVEPAMQDFVVSLGGDPASTGEMSQAFRDTYRRMLRQESHFGRLFDAIKKFDVAKNFTEIVDVFMNTIGRDLASTGPSTDRAFLHALMTELGKLKNLRSVFEAVKELITTTERSLPSSDRGKLDPMGLASDILNFCAKSVVSLTDAQALVQTLKGYSLQIQVVFANGVIDLLATIPDNVIDSRARLQQKATLNTLRDHLVAAEEKDHEAHAT